MRVGVIGCGLIAQMMHLPHLKELHDLYGAVALCDVSPRTLKYVGEYYGVTKRFSDYRDLLKEPLNAVTLFSADSHGQVQPDGSIRS
jgi:predicted dehydrogenase